MRLLKLGLNAPLECTARFVRHVKLGIQTPIPNFECKRGGSLAGEAVYIVWRIPRRLDDRDETEAFRLQASCLQQISLYQSRVQKALFLSSIVHPNFICSKVVAMAVYEFITGDRLPVNHSKDRRHALTVSAFSIASQDMQL